MIRDLLEPKQYLFELRIVTHTATRNSNLPEGGWTRDYDQTSLGNSSCGKVAEI